MATRVGTENSPVGMLEHLMALDYDAIEAYEAAIDRLDDEACRARMASFRADHERHVGELEPAIDGLGGNPPQGAGAKAMLTQGKVATAGLVGDEAILEAMRSNEDDTCVAYERALAKAPAEVRAILLRGLDDERRHRQWLLVAAQGPLEHLARTTAQEAGSRPSP